MAPEQALGQELTPATDVYALATVLYELIARQLPYPSSGSTLAILHSHAYDRPTPLIEHVPGLPPILHDVVMKGIANDPTQRYLTAAEFGTAIHEAAASIWGPTWRTSPEIAEILGAESDGTATTGGQPQIPTQVETVAETFEDAKPTAHTMVVRKTTPVSMSERMLTNEDQFASVSSVVPDSGHQTTEVSPSVSPSHSLDTETFTSLLAPIPRQTWRRKLLWGAGLVLLLVTAVAVWGLFSYLTRANTSEAVLPSGGVLKAGQEMTSPNDRYALRMQNDGNLVEYGARGPIWATGTSGNKGAYVLLQPVGNLVIYPKGKGPPPPGSRTTPALWASSTEPHSPGVYLRLENSGRIELIVPQSKEIAWEAAS
jgi:hypothetical protein